MGSARANPASLLAHDISKRARGQEQKSACRLNKIKFFIQYLKQYPCDPYSKCQVLGYVASSLGLWGVAKQGDNDRTEKLCFQQGNR